MQFEFLDLVIQQWAAYGQTFQSWSSKDYSELSQRDAKKLREVSAARHELATGALRSMRDLRQALIDWGDEEHGPRIGNLSAGYALESYKILDAWVSDASASDADRTEAAFAACRKVAQQLKADLKESVRQERQMSAYLTASKTPGFSTVRDQVSRLNETMVSKVYLPMLDQAISGNVEFIVNKFDRILELASVGTSMVGTGFGALTQSPLGSLIGAGLGYATKWFLKPRLKAKQKQQEEAYREAAVMTLALFLLPFIGCVLGHVRVVEYTTARSIK